MRQTITLASDLETANVILEFNDIKDEQLRPFANEPEALKERIYNISIYSKNINDISHIAYKGNEIKFKTKINLDYSLGENNRRYYHINSGLSDNRDVLELSQERTRGYELAQNSKQTIILKIPRSILMKQRIKDLTLENKWFKYQRISSEDKRYYTISSSYITKERFVHSTELNDFHNFIEQNKEQMLSHVLALNPQ